MLDRSISSYRVFKWWDTNKVGLADASDAKTICDALNVTSTYEWWRGKDENLMPDVECVPHHYKENYPVASACGSSTTSAHMKTTNEPRNPADEPKNNPESLELILSNWESLMRTGMRHGMAATMLAMLADSCANSLTPLMLEVGVVTSLTCIVIGQKVLLTQCKTGQTQYIALFGCRNGYGAPLGTIMVFLA